MASRLAATMDRRRRIRKTVRYLEAQLEVQPDVRLSLDELADVACLSPYHFIRLYHHAVGETPQATVRRVKLRAAHHRLIVDRNASVTMVALDTGYDNAQAFARAYRRQFGAPPSIRASATDRRAAVDVSAIVFPRMRPCTRQIGSLADPWVAFDELVGHLTLQGLPKSSERLLAVLSPDSAFTHACVLDSANTREPLPLARQAVGGGWHACLRGLPQEVWHRAQHDFHLAALRCEDRPLLLYYLNDPSYRLDDEQRIELFVPLRPDAAVDEIARAFPLTTTAGAIAA
ncbi:helix-turn-helix transcriptional regulator [Vineibacter terrae]|nr:helix-turn-helix transcriptional regulator [Vineibacter terrae]